ncbi:hypothetical protein [Variovorax sp. N23]|nr:hypothetical protein [Variovorax sp. N23]
MSTFITGACGFVGPRAVLFLASSDTRFLTGAELMIDGGWMAA